MRLKCIAIYLAALSITSCNWGAAKKNGVSKTKDTLSYAKKVIKRRAADCGTKPDSECTVASIVYPVFKGQGKLNDTVRSRLVSLFSVSDKDPGGLEQLSADFIKLYNENKNPDEKDLFYTLDIGATVQNQDDGLVTLAVGGYQFSGGAHGGNERTFVNWDTQLNKLIGLKDIFVENYRHKLNRIAEHLFRKQEKVGDDVSLGDNYFFENGVFALNDNFSITPQGLNFLYNEYEIKPYSEGITELLIPYSQIKSLLKPHTVITQYIK